MPVDLQKLPHNHSCGVCSRELVDTEDVAALEKVLHRLIDLDEKKPTENPVARAIIEDARILLRRYRVDPPEHPHE